MSKKILLVLMCAISLIACNNEEDSCQGIKNMILKASIESELTDSRAGLETDGSFFWQEGDKIAALMTNGKVRPMTLEEGDGGKSSGDFKIATNETFGKYAFYPYSSTNKVNAAGELTIDFPSSYDYGNVIGEKENSFNFAMWGYLVNETVSFKHLGGVFKIYVHNLPVGEDMQFVFKATGKKIAGEFNADLTDSEPVLVTSEDNTNDNVVITFDNATADATGVFYIPVPTGTYPEIDVVLKMSDGEEFAFGYWTNQTVVRRAQKKGNIGEKTITGGEGDSAVKTVASVEDITNSVLATDKEDLLVQVVEEVTGSENVILIPSTLETETTTFSFASVADDAVITILNAELGAYSGQIIIEIPENETIPTVNANIPDGEVYIKQGTVTTLVVSSAQNTTIIGAKAKIVNLVVEKGNVRIENGATVSNITRSSSNQDELTYVIFEGELPSEKNSDSKIIYVSAVEFGLYQAAKNGGTYTLTDDVTLSEILVIEKDFELDGNGKTLTYTGSGASARAIDVPSSANGVNLTVKNLTVDCTSSYCQRGINYNTNGKLVLDNVTVKGTNVSYALNLPGSSVGANVEIKNSSLTANIALNVWGKNSVVNVTDSHLTSVDTASHENYSAVVLNNDGTTIADGAVITITGGTITAKDENGNASNAVRNGTNTGLVQVSETTTVIGNYADPVAIVTYGTDQFYSCETLQRAISKAIETNAASVRLLKDIELSEILVIEHSLTLDGNGKTLTSTAARAINVSGADGVTIKNLTINASGERAINIIQNATNVTIDNVTATAANYTVNVASSAPNAKVVIKNSTLNGLCTVNVSAASANVTVDNSTINCNDNNTIAGESYAALSLNKEAVGGKIIATNSTINVAEGSDSMKGRNGAENGTVTIDGSTDDVVVVVACIMYPGSSYYHGFLTLKAAVEFAKEGDVITLLRDIELSETIVVNKTITIDLNGKTVSSVDETEKNYELIKNQGNLTIKGGGKLTVKATKNSGWNRYSAVIANTVGGTLTVKDVTIEHLGGTDMAYGIDNLTNGKGTSAITTIDGATVISPYRAVRQFLNGVEAANELYVKSGSKLYGDNKAIFFHDPSKNANTGKLVVESGCQINGDIYLYVTEGSTEWPVEVSIADSALAEGKEVLSGNVPEGYSVVNTNGIWTVSKSAVQ